MDETKEPGNDNPKTVELSEEQQKEIAEKGIVQATPEQIQKLQEERTKKVKRTSLGTAAYSDEVVDATNPEVNEVYKIIEEANIEFFREVLRVGSVHFSKMVPTACVSSRINVKANKLEKIYFHFNPDFWAKLTPGNRAFITAHETLHVFYNHVARGYKKDGHTWNMAIDAIINDILVEQTALIDMPKDPDGKISGVTGEALIKRSAKNMTAEELYNKLMKIAPPQLYFVDCHDMSEMVDSSGQGQGQGQGSFSGKLGKAAEKKEQEKKDGEGKDGKDGKKADAGGNKPKPVDLSECDGMKTNIGEKVAANQTRQAGVGHGQTAIELRDIKVNAHWEKFLEIMDREIEDTWTDVNRVMISVYPDVVLPARKRVYNRVNIAIAVDTSGSVSDEDVDIFFSLIRRTPYHKYDIKLIAFDDGYQVLDIHNLDKSQIEGRGGTDFGKIEDYLLTLKEYPDFVYVLTDGAGNNPKAKFPDRWTWFLNNNSGNQCSADFGKKVSIAHLYS